MVIKSDPTIPAGRFKAECLAILNEVRDSRRPVVITKRGRPVARLVPVEEPTAPTSLRGSILHEGDLVSPLDENWNAS